MTTPRSTRATAAVERLKERSGNPRYSMARTGAGALAQEEQDGAAPLCEPLELDQFVAFVNGLGPQIARRMSKLDAAFEKQLTKNKTP